jgi:hypothetical protein
VTLENIWWKTFFFEKRTKTLCEFGLGLSWRTEAESSKVFCFFFSKKKCFPASLSAVRRGTAPTPVLPQSGAGRSWAVKKRSKKLLADWASALLR